ncbi:hypothetical protein V8C26DRAFT_363982 [Trichoderma gracile]
MRTGNRSQDYMYTCIAIAPVVAILGLFRFASTFLLWLRTMPRFASVGSMAFTTLVQFLQAGPTCIRQTPNAAQPLAAQHLHQVIAPTLHRSSIAHAAAVQVDGEISRLSTFSVRNSRMAKRCLGTCGAGTKH